MQSHPHRALRLVLLLLTAMVGLSAMAATASADREFSLRYSANETGSIKGIANTNMTCSTANGATGAGTCTDARNAGITDSVNSANDFRNNNAHTSAYIDVDSDSSTFNSSTANQSLPAGSSVLYAALYWGGHYSGASSPADASLRDRVKFKVPGASSYTTVTASTLDDGIGANAGRYQAFADVTNLIKTLPNGGNGTYTVANIQAAIGSDRYAGWSLIVAYKNPNESMKNMTIFDGLVSISGTTTRDINVSGFLTPPAGPINAQIGFVTWEGDLGLNGDRARLNGQYLSDAQHPSTNFFDSRISHNGSLFTDRNPAYPNSLGMDAAWTTPPNGAIGNNATSATITVNSTGDQYLPGVITFQVEIFSPNVKQTKTATDENGGDLEQGDVITYRIKGKNTGDDGTSNFVLRDPIPVNTTYVPGSIHIVKSGASGPTGAKTDASGDDQAEFDSGNNRVIARLGDGSNTSVGGNIAPGEEYELTFQVRVNGPDTDPVPNLTVIENEATATFNSQTGGITLKSEADTDVTVKAPDLRILKTRSGDDFVAGGTSEYTLAVDNHGDAGTQGQVTVSDPLADGLTATAVNAPGWSCNTLPADHITCTRSDALAAGNSYPDIVVTVAIDDDVTDEVENLATVSGGGDANLGDNTSSSTNPVSRTADLAIVKSASQNTIKIGDNFTYSLEVTNNGPSRATSVAVSDEIPAGLSFVSADPGCTFEPLNGTVTCALGNMAKDETRTIEIEVTVDGDAGGPITNTASVSAQQTDPNPDNNTSSTTVDASGADLQVTKTTESPDEIGAGDTVTYKVVVTNNGPSDATGVVLYDALPAGLSNVTTDNDDCTVAEPSITCVIGDLANGDSVTIEVTGKAGADVSELTNTASATGNEDDPDPGNNSSTVVDPVTPRADLGITKEASVDEIHPGENFLYTFKVKNNGPSNVTGITVTDTLPAGVTYVDGPPGCSASGQTVTCTIHFLASGGSGQTGITVKYNGDGDSVENTATVSSNVSDPNPDNDSSTIETPVQRDTDVEIVKTVDNATPTAGDTITYTLTVKNNGPGEAENVVATDQLPSGVTFVSADAPCTEAAGKVTCALGTLAPGEQVKLKIKVKVNPWAPAPASDVHMTDVQKVETQIDLEAGQTRTVTAQCPEGYFVSDGSVRIDHIDQGTGSWLAPEVTESRAVDGRTWQGTVTNTASGRAQAKIFAVCIRETTSPNSHEHDLVVSDPVIKTVSLKPGSNTATLKCPAGTVAIAPGFIADSPGHMTYSQPEGNGWKFVYDTIVDRHGDKITFSIRCLDRTLSETHGSSPQLRLERIWTEQVIQPGQVHEVQLICPDGSKGIVGGWDLDDGLYSLGNDPRPVTRAFKVYNPTDKPLTVRYSLLCLGDRTGSANPGDETREIHNTGKVTTTTSETDTTNNSSSVTVTASQSGGSTGGPVPNGNGKPPVNNPTDRDTDRPGATVLRAGAKAKVRHGKVRVRVTATGKAHGVARLVTVTRVRIHGRTYRRGTLIATGRYSFNQAGSRTLVLRTTPAGRKLLRKRGAVRKARLILGGKSIRTVRISR